jgi:calpain
MEKAYAKLHLHYQVLNGGSVSEAMVDLTGMVAEKYELQKSAELTHSLNTG